MDLVFSRTRKIPSKSWGRECSLCSSRHGVPIECSARGCKAAYHTTCAIRGKLKMQAIFGKDFKGGIKLRSYCKEHSPSVEVVQNGGVPSQDDKIDASGVKEIDMTNLVDDRLHEDNEELDYFWKYVDINEVQKNLSESYAAADKLRSESLNPLIKKEFSSTGSPKKDLPKKNYKKDNKDGTATSKKKSNKSKDNPDVKTAIVSRKSSRNYEIDPFVLDLIYRYWILLRTSNNGQSLMKFSASALKKREFEQRKSILKLRIELERVRNLSYMISRREKLKAAWLKTHQSIIKRTFSVINDLDPISEDVKPDVAILDRKIKNTNHQTSSHHNNNNNFNHHNHHNQSNHNHHNSNHNYYGTSSGSTINNTKKANHLHPPNGMFDESDQLINDLISCDQIYQQKPTTSGHTTGNSNHSNLSYEDLSTLERRRTLSLVRRINRQLKTISAEPMLNPYARNYMASKRSDSPASGANTPNDKSFHSSSSNSTSTTMPTINHHRMVKNK